MARLSEDIGVDALLDLTGAGREAKAYAFLYAAFRRTEVGTNPVRDAIDCLIPFMVPYLEEIPGQSIKVDAVCKYMKSKFGFDFPLYAMQQLIADLPKHGLADYNRIAKAHIARAGPKDEFKVAKSEIETNFDDISYKLSDYAISLQFHQEPPSGTWGDALIHFLRGNIEPTKKVAVKVRAQLLDAHKSEAAVVGSFISKLYNSAPTTFEKVLHIFMGILVEEFISSVSEIGNNDNLDVIVLYDTAVLLRLLGTSGSLLKTATEELTRYLQDLGCKIYYFSGNESEIENIFSTIVHIKDSGGELEGETADAISRGETTITDIRMLQNSFPERLAALNVFPADNLPTPAQIVERHQINESGFSAFLLEQANVTGRRYGVENRNHDAQYLGLIMRMRAGSKTRDFGNCGYVFVTSNRFLAYASRRFLIQDQMLAQQHFPPIVSLGQVATIAWLMKDRKLAPEKAGRELLANCFAAVRPDAEWFKYFREGLEKAVGSMETYGREGTNTLTLQAARRLAQEESLGSATLVRELNMAEILSRATAEREAEAKRQQAELEAVQADAASEKAALLVNAQAKQEAALAEAKRQHSEAMELEREQAAAATAELLRQSRIARSERWARRIVMGVRGVLLIFFLGATAWSITLRIQGETTVVLWILTVALGIVQVVTFANFLKIPVISNWIPNCERWLADKIFSRQMDL
jgi:hypothetical protein